MHELDIIGNKKVIHKAFTYFLYQEAIRFEIKVRILKVIVVLSGEEGGKRKPGKQLATLSRYPTAPGG